MAQIALPSIELLRESTVEELNKVIEESQQTLLEIRTQANFAPVPKPHLIRSYKKLIAQCKTVLNDQ